MIGAILVMNGTRKKPGVINVKEFDPDSFMEALNQYGLYWMADENPVLTVG